MPDAPAPSSAEARLRAIRGAVAAVEQAERDLQDAVDEARAAGDPDDAIELVLAARDAGVRGVVGELVDALGPAYVAALAGATSKEQASEWAGPEGSAPGPEAARRLRIAHTAWARVAGARGRDAARDWILRPDPALNGDSPLVAIKRDRVRDLTAVVDALLAAAPDR